MSKITHHTSNKNQVQKIQMHSSFLQKGGRREQFQPFHISLTKSKQQTTTAVNVRNQNRLYDHNAAPDMLQKEIFKHFTVVNVIHQKPGTSCVHTVQWHREATSPAQHQAQHI